MSKPISLKIGGLLLLMLGLLTALTVSAASFPKIIPLPSGFNPEGIAVGRGHTAYAGSLNDGTIYAVDLRSGEGDTLVPGAPGERIAVGLDVDERSNYLFVAGGPTGQGFVYDAATGTEIDSFNFTTMPTFVNDVIVTRDAAYFSDSFRPFFYRVPLGPGGSLDGSGVFEEIALGSGFLFNPGGFNSNGIVASENGKALIIVNSGTGTLYKVDPRTGDATPIDLDGEAVPSGDGLVLKGQTLYVVQNFFNKIAKIELSADLLEGEIVGEIFDPAFRIPTTAALFGDSLYAVNARFDAPTATEFEIVRVDK